MKGGSVEFTFKGDTSDIESKANGLSNKLTSLVSTGKVALIGLATAAATAIIKITKEAVVSAGELEQQIGGTEAVFGDLAKVVQNDATKAFDKMVLSLCRT